MKRLFLQTRIAAHALIWLLIGILWWQGDTLHSLSSGNPQLTVLYGFQIGYFVATICLIYLTRLATLHFKRFDTRGAHGFFVMTQPLANKKDYDLLRCILAPLVSRKTAKLVEARMLLKYNSERPYLCICTSELLTERKLGTIQSLAMVSAIGMALKGAGSFESFARTQGARDGGIYLGDTLRREFLRKLVLRRLSF